MPAQKVVGLSFKLPAKVEKRGKYYVAHCAALDVTSQGTTKRKALDALTEATALFLEVCVEEKTIGPVLESLGFVHLAEGRNDRSALDGDVIDVPLELISNAKNPSRQLANA